MSHIYTECGALGRLLLLRSYHNLHTGKRNQPHTFLYNTESSRGRGVFFTIMKNLLYNILAGTVNFICVIICAVSSIPLCRIIFACLSLIPIIIAIILNYQTEKELEKINAKQETIDNEFKIKRDKNGDIVSKAVVDCGEF